MLTPKPAQSSALQYFLFVSSKKAGGSLTYKLQSPGVTPLPTPPVSLGLIFITKGQVKQEVAYLKLHLQQGV